MKGIIKSFDISTILSMVSNTKCSALNGIQRCLLCYLAPFFTVVMIKVNWVSVCVNNTVFIYVWSGLLVEEMLLQGSAYAKHM